MYFWRINKLIQELKNESISQREYVKYLLGCIFVYQFNQFKQLITITEIQTEVLLKHFSGKISLNLFLLLEVLSFLIFIWGVFHCYKMNTYKSDNKNFLQRFICLSFTQAIRYIPFIFVISIFIFLRHHYYYPAHFSGDELDIAQMKFIIFVKIIFAFITIHYYFRLGKKVNFNPPPEEVAFN